MNILCINNNGDKNNELKISTFLTLVIVSLLSFLCYVNTLQAGFVYDDQRAILTNQDLHTTRSWLSLFYNDFWGTPLSHSGSHKSYRPLCVLSFKLNYFFGQLNPWGYHLVNNVLHCMASCIFAYVCKQLYGKQWMMLLGGVMFSTHPIHTEAVAGIVGRADVGAAIFFLLALLSYQRTTSEDNTTNIPWLFSCMVCALLSLYTKEQGVTVLGVCIVYEVLIVSKCNLADLTSCPWKLYATGGLYRIVALLLYATILIYTRLLIMGYSPPSFSPSDNPAANSPDILTRFLTFAYLPFCNLWLLIYPFHLSYDWSMDTIPLIDTISRYENVFSLTLYIGLLFVIYRYYNFCSMHHKQSMYAKHKKVTKAQSKEETFVYNSLNLMVFSIACMVLPFLPATNLFFYVGFVLAERILYIPSIGFCLLILNGIHLLLTYKRQYDKLIVVSTVSILCMFFARTYARNFDWLSEEALYKSGLSTSPAKSWSNLANIYNKQNKFKEAENAYKIALEIRPNMGDTNYNLGLLLQNQGRYEEAIQWYNTAITYRPTLAAAYLNLGITFKIIGKIDDAFQIFKKGYNISDHGLKDPLAHHNSLTHLRDHTGRILFESGRTKEAIAVFLDALKRMPDGYEAVSIYNMLGQCYSALSQGEIAESWYKKALTLKPDHVPALLTYSKHITGRNPQKSEQLLKKALSLEPNRTESLVIYATHLKGRGRTPEALKTLNTAFHIDQKDTYVLNELSTLHREMKDYEEAKRYQILLKKLKPNDVSVRTNLGALYHILGETNNASIEYNEALKIDPNDAILRDNINRLERVLNKSR